MKNILLIVILTGYSLHAPAQGFLQIGAGSHIVSVNNAYMVIDNLNVVNNGTYMQAMGDGTTRFTGNMDISISGSSMSKYDKLNIAKTASKIMLMQNVNVVALVNFTSGMIDLGNSILDLGTTGMVTGETDAHGLDTYGMGYIQVMNILNAPSMANPGNLGAIITSNKNLGNVTIQRGHKVQLNVSGTSPGIRRYYDILAANDNGLKATLRFQYFNTELNGLDESQLELWAQNKNKWANIGYDSRDANNNYVEKINNNSLSARWTLAEPKHPLIPLNNIYSKTSKMENKGLESKLSVWPNPASQTVYVTINAFNSSSMLLKLYDPRGALILTRQGKLLAGKNLMTFDLSNLAAGSYTLVAALMQYTGANLRPVRLSQTLIKQ